jgi:DNA repair protein RadC
MQPARTIPVAAGRGGGYQRTENSDQAARERTRAMPKPGVPVQTEFNFRSLMVKEENGRYRMATGEEILEAARAELERRVRRCEPLTSPDLTREFLRVRLAPQPFEIFAALWLDNRHRVIRFEEMFRGTIDGASVHPREVVRAAMQHNAAACILAHNHPSGVAEPSQADLRITQRLKDALALVDVRVLDHMIVGESITSFAERGLL